MSCLYSTYDDGSKTCGWRSKRVAGSPPGQCLATPLSFRLCLHAAVALSGKRHADQCMHLKAHQSIRIGMMALQTVVRGGTLNMVQTYRVSQDDNRGSAWDEHVLSQEGYFVLYLLL